MNDISYRLQDATQLAKEHFHSETPFKQAIPGEARTERLKYILQHTILLHWFTLETVTYQCIMRNEARTHFVAFVWWQHFDAL